MVRKFQLKPQWGGGNSPITLPNQILSSTSESQVQLESDFFASFPLPENDARSRPHIAVTLRYIRPTEPVVTEQPGSDISKGYKLELINDSATSIFISNNQINGLGPSAAPLALSKGESAVVSVGSTIGWGSFGCSTVLSLSEDLPEEPRGVTESASGHSSLQSTHSDSTSTAVADSSCTASTESPQKMDVDPPSEDTQPQSRLVKKEDGNVLPRLPLDSFPGAALGAPQQAERNPLKEAGLISPPDLIRPTPDGRGVKMAKTDQVAFPSTSGNIMAPAVISPRGSSAFKDASSLRPDLPGSAYPMVGGFWPGAGPAFPYAAMPSGLPAAAPGAMPGGVSALKHSMPQNLNELATTSAGGMISPRASLGIPVSSMPASLSSLPSTANVMSSPRSAASAMAILPGPPGGAPSYSQMMMEAPFLSSGANLSPLVIRDLQSRHAAELETVVARHQIEISQLVAQHRLELDSLLRGGPLLPPNAGLILNGAGGATAPPSHPNLTSAAGNGANNGSSSSSSSSIANNFGLLHILQSLQSPGSPFSRPGTSMSNSDEIDVVSIEEPQAWKVGPMAPSASSAKPKKQSGANSGRTPNKKDSSAAGAAAAAATTTTTNSSSSHHHHHHHHQPSQYAQRMASGASTPASESGSEDDGNRRAQRKRKAPVQPDFFVDDREMDQILGGNNGKNKRRAEAPTNDSFPMPAAVPVSSPVTPAASPMLPTMPYKKPKPRDNVAIATILDIYSPLKSLQPQWKFTRGAKTLILYHTDCLDHVTPDWHLESPNRLKAVMESIQLIQERYGDYAEIISTFSPADMAIVRQCHEEAYIKKITSKIPVNRAMPPLHATQDIDLSLSMSMSLMKSNSSDPEAACEPPKDTFVSFGSWNAALLAAGSVIEAIDRLMAKPTKLRNAFCGVRPPGHHAGSHGHDGASTNGYCVLNSVAIGAQHAFNKYNFKKIAILDFDVHQGNGTAQIVERDPRILFISLHASEIYPFSESTKADADKCTDRIINIGYPTGTNGKQFMELFLNRCKQLLIDFSPELILLSSGFDAHIDDPTGAGMLRFADYVALTRVVKEIADTPACRGRVISVLEGGYDIRALKLSVTAHLLALMEGPSCPPAPGEPEDEPEPEPEPAAIAAPSGIAAPSSEIPEAPVATPSSSSSSAMETS